MCVRESDDGPRFLPPWQEGQRTRTGSKGRWIHDDSLLNRFPYLIGCQYWTSRARDEITRFGWRKMTAGYRLCRWTWQSTAADPFLWTDSYCHWRNKAISGETRSLVKGWVFKSRGMIQLKRMYQWYAELLDKLIMEKCMNLRVWYERILWLLSEFKEQ